MKYTAIIKKADKEKVKCHKTATKPHQNRKKI